MPTLFLHIGMTKTGTSSIQRFFSDNYEEIYGLTNLYYPLSGRVEAREDGMGWMHRGLFPVNACLEAWESLKAEIAARPDADILLSEEAISFYALEIPESFLGRPDMARKSRNNFLDAEVIHFIQQAFPEHRIKIVCSFRRMDDYIKSYFTQFARFGILSTYNDFLAEYFQHRMPGIFQSRLLDLCFELIGQDNVVPLLYRAEGAQKNVLPPFLAALGISLPDSLLRLGETMWENRSVNSRMLPFLYKELFPQGMAHQDKLTAVHSTRKAFSYPGGSNAGDHYMEEAEKEIERIEARIPGYKELFSHRPLSFSYPDLDADPIALLHTSLLYQLMDQVSTLGGKVDEMKEEVRRLKGEPETIAALKKEIEAYRHACREMATKLRKTQLE